MAVELMPRTRVLEPLQEWIPPLENGDRLTHVEFWRRYLAMPENVHAELIEGVVYMTSPIRIKRHSHPTSKIAGWLSVYEAATPGVQSGSAGTARVDPDNTVEPDAFLRIETTAGGQSEIGDDDYLDGAPELIVEIAASTVSNDLHTKLNIYRRTQVQEYIVWRTQDQALDWFRLRAGKYERVEPDVDGIIRSEMFPGLWLAVNQLLDGDLAGVLAELQRGIASAEHQTFVEKLSSASA